VCARLLISAELRRLVLLEGLEIQGFYFDCLFSSAHMAFRRVPGARRYTGK
jgi:hypothetical protein